jgi:hypothetical protein
MTTINARLKLRRDTDANILTTVVDAYEPLYASDTHKLYISDGATKTEIPLLQHVNYTATGDIGVNHCNGSVINNYGQAAEATLTLPAAASGLHLRVIVSATGNALHIKAGAGDKIYLENTALDDGDKVSLATPEVADNAEFFAFQTGASAWDWCCQTGAGTWTDGGA